MKREIVGPYFIRLHIVFCDWFQFSGWDSIQKTIYLRYQKRTITGEEVCALPLQNREVKINLSISDELLQICFTDTTDRINIRCPPGQLNDRK
jgi:hypothetical protein